MNPDEAQDIENEVREELERRCSIASSRGSLHSQEEAQERPQDHQGQGEEELSLNEIAQADDVNEDGGGDDVEVRRPKKKAKKTVQIQEKSLFGKKCYKIFK